MKEIRFKQYILDPFQIEAVNAIENNESVVVTAQTGSGKTLIADYVIDKFLDSGKRVIYTAPIKALSNQKFRDFKNVYGAENIGIMTGDVVINSYAPILIMTTEIYRNMLLCNDPCIHELSYVVFDEIHYINDIERGTIWEESLIFSPSTIRFLCLSATIPNAHEFAAWISSIKGHIVRVVSNEKRVVPLQHMLFDGYLGLTDCDAVEKHQKDIAHTPEYRRKRNEKKKKRSYPLPYHVDLVRELKSKDMLPAIYFIFSRKACQDKATELAKEMCLVDNKEVAAIIHIYNTYVTSDIRNLSSSQMLKHVLQKGVAFHHAGLLPKLKELVEELFGMGLIKALYATETFAVGINMPAKAVCFNSLEKYDGVSFRYLHTKEYFQLAGRAGRRGIDTIGYAIAMFDRNRGEIAKVRKLTEKDIEPIVSQFTLSYNTVLSLVKQHNLQEIEIILKQSFDYYLKHKKTKNMRIMASFANKVRILKKFGYISRDNTLTEKGEVARLIYAHELMIAELCVSGIWKQMDDIGFLTTLAAIMSEQRRGVEFYKKHNQQRGSHTLHVLSKNAFIFKKFNVKSFKNLYPIIAHWYNEGKFIEMMDFANLLEGDYIRMFRQLLDMTKQIKRATGDYDLIDLVERCTLKIDRDLVKVEL